MKLSSVILARTLAYVEAFDLVATGQAYFPEIVAELVKRYGFLKFPKTIEEFDQNKGVEFGGGRAGNRVIERFAIFDTLLLLETRSNTTDSKQILEEMLSWATSKFSLDYQPDMVKHFAYVSGLSFYSEKAILQNRALDGLAQATSRAVSEIWNEPIVYSGLSLALGHDPLSRKYAMANFVIARRAEAKFEENKYYSEAPLPTDVHIKLLEEFESELAVQIPATGIVIKQIK
jgi:hypothetical protein